MKKPSIIAVRSSVLVTRGIANPVANPQRVAYSREVAELLDLKTDVCESDEFIRVFAGNRLAAGMEPYATCYGGHQFGNWAGQLGDGRAINLGEVINRKGERWALQLKGAGLHLLQNSRRFGSIALIRARISVQRGHVSFGSTHHTRIKLNANG